MYCLCQGHLLTVGFLLIIINCKVVYVIHDIMQWLTKKLLQRETVSRIDSVCTAVVVLIASKTLNTILCSYAELWIVFIFSH